MYYTLMHKDIPVLTMDIDDATGAILGIGEVFDAKHVPVGIRAEREVDRADLNHWWLGRSIPASRSGVRDALEELGVYTPHLLLTKCLGLSLSDQYWVKPEGQDVHWADVNFFQNPFSDDVGNILFEMPTGSEQISLMSPDNTSDGMLKKRWKILDGKRCLIKGGSSPFHQEPLNEVFASQLMERLGVEHVPYEITWIQDTPYSLCPDFISENTELVSAHHIRKTLPLQDGESKHEHFLRCCGHLGIPGMLEQTDRMLTIDYLIANEDRHMNNFGAIRDATTLEWLSPAPIFDCGTSLWFDNLFRWGVPEDKAPSKPFAENHAEQIKLVSAFDWLDMDALAGTAEMLRTTFEAAPNFMEIGRVDIICEAFENRIRLLDEHIAEFTIKPGDNEPEMLME